MGTFLFCLIYALPAVTIAFLIWTVHRCRKGLLAPWGTPKEVLMLLIPAVVVSFAVSAYVAVAYYAPQERGSIGFVIKWIGAIAVAVFFILSAVVMSAVLKRPELPDDLRSRFKAMPVLSPICAVLVLIFAALI